MQIKQNNSKRDQIVVKVTNILDTKGSNDGVDEEQGNSTSFTTQV